MDYLLSDIEGVRLEIVDGLNPKRGIFIRLKEKKEMLLKRILFSRFAFNLKSIVR